MGSTGQESRGRGRFVGRHAELSELAAGLDDAVEGQGRGFLVLGDAGMGKTRLATELGDHARATGALVLWGRCWEAGGAPPYWPWTEVRRAAEAAGAPAMEAPGTADRFELFAAMGAFLRHVSARRPTLVVLDDLHAADLPSLLLLEYLLGGALRQSRTVIVALAREHELASTDAGRRIRRLAQTITLRGLSRDEVAVLIEHSVAASPSQETVDAVNDATEGNPLFVEELAALMVRGLPGLASGIRETIRHRLDALPPHTIELLSVGAVMGRDFDIDVVGGVVTADAAAIDRAVRGGVVAATRRGRYRFAHILVRDVLYEDIPAAARARLHGDIGRALENHHRADLEDHLDEIAHHFVAAGDTDRPRAVEYLLRAGAQAEQGLAHERAVAHYEQALELAGGDEGASRCDVLLALGRAADRAGRVEQAKDAFARAAEIARRRADGARLAHATLGLAARVAFQQHDGGMVAALDEALAGVAPDDDALRARLLAALARNLGYAGLRGRMAGVAERAVAAARVAGDADVLADALDAWQLTLWTPDHVDDRLQTATELLELAERSGDRRRALDGHMSRMICQLELGDTREFDRSLAAYCRLADELREPRYRFMGLARRAMRQLMRGDYEDGRRLAEEARRLGNECQEPDAEPVYHGVVALPSRDDGVGLDDVERFFVDFSTRHTSAGSRALLAALAVARGDRAAARRDLDAVAVAIDDLPKDLDWLLCLALCAEVAHELDDAHLAARLVPLLAPYEDRCVVIAGAVGFAGCVAHHLGLLALTLGRVEDADRHLAAAAARYRAMGAEPWLVRLHRHRGDVGSRPARRGTAVLHRRDGRWLVRSDVAEFHVPDSKGFHHLAVLLSRPGREVHVLELAAPTRVAEGDTGPMLDGAAKAAYRRRLEELEEDLEEAEAWADSERAARARAELDAVAAQLAAALGVGGRDRTAPTNADRARVSVRKAIVRALREVERHDATLGRYLRTTVRTGTYCVYDPDPRFPTTWDVEA